MSVSVTKANSDPVARRLVLLGAITGFGLLPVLDCQAAPAPKRAFEKPESAGGGAAQASSVWISCDEGQHVAYRIVPAGHNPHNAFTRPIEVHLKPAQTCAELK